MEIRIIRSKKRARTISARAEDGVFVVRAPAHMSDACIREHQTKLGFPL